MLFKRRVFLAGSAAAATFPVAARAALPPYRIPFKLTDNRVVVDCTIGGQGPFLFIFDTGGTIGLIDMELAKQLKLRQVGSRVLGMKQGHIAHPIYAVPDLAFAGRIRQPSSAIAGIASFNFMDGAVGSIAAGALTQGNCELDFDAKEWRIYRDEQPDRAGWTSYPKGIFRSGTANGSAFMAADATLGGHTCRFGLDTGMPTTMRIYRKTAEASGLWDAPHWSPTAPEGKGRMVRTQLHLAGETLSNVIVTITENPDWDPFPNGVIGLPILRQFNIATAATQEAVFLKRNKVSPVPERYNRAGLWIDHAGPNALISVVGPGSPAEKAGLKAGDLLLAVEFKTLIQRMFEPAGTKIKLSVEQAGVHREIELTLEDYL